MSDKDHLVIIGEMLRKQDQYAEKLAQQAEKIDQQSEKLDQHSEILSLHSEILNEHTNLLKRHIDISNKQTDIINQQSRSINEVKDVLKQFVGVSVVQFQKQEEFNNEINERFKSQDLFNKRQEQFNERVFDKLDNIEKGLKK